MTVEICSSASESLPVEKITGILVTFDTSQIHVTVKWQWKFIFHWFSVELQWMYQNSVTCHWNSLVYHWNSRYIFCGDMAWSIVEKNFLYQTKQSPSGIGLYGL